MSKSRAAQNGDSATLGAAMNRIIKEEIQQNEQLLQDAEILLQKIIASKAAGEELTELIEIIIIMLYNQQTINEEQHKQETQ